MGPVLSITINSPRSACPQDLPPGLGIASEHGFYHRRPNTTEWIVKNPNMDLSWKDAVHEIVQAYAESTDGSWVEVRGGHGGGVVWGRGRVRGA